MNFIVINEGFKCQKCDTKNAKSPSSCRNHCRKCLYSLHVDEKIPGDRSSDCHGLMIPINIEQTGKKGWMIVHQCLKCSKKIPNKTAPDDNFDQLMKLSQNINT